MAKATLPTNFTDDIMNSSMNGRRKYNMIYNSDGTVSFEDVTEYDQIGSDFGAAQVNAINKAVNESVDVAKVIQDIDDIASVTEDGYIAGALSVNSLQQRVNELNTKLTASDTVLGVLPYGLSFDLKPNNDVYAALERLGGFYISNGADADTYHAPTSGYGIAFGQGTTRYAILFIGLDGKLYTRRYGTDWA